MFYIPLTFDRKIVEIICASKFVENSVYCNEVNIDTPLKEPQLMALGHNYLGHLNSVQEFVFLSRF